MTPNSRSFQTASRPPHPDGDRLPPWLARQLQTLLDQRGHALLLAGPSGLGQYELALALARAWLCEQPTAAGACGQCTSCHAVDVRTHADLLVLLPEQLALDLDWPLDERTRDKIEKKEVKASKWIRVEAARAVVDFGQTTRSRGATKLVLVYPADRLNTESANTLLKTLEEPAGDLRFVLATESAQSLLPTINALEVVGKKLDEVKLVTSGAGAAALACLDLLGGLGLARDNVVVTDIAGVVYQGRVELMDPRKEKYARKTDARSLADAIKNADVFLGLSAPRVLTPQMVAQMCDRPIIFALANPTPEILPEEVRTVRPHAIIATGRSDYPNQVNNVLCFPFIFRGALDVGATQINEAMKIACVHAIAKLARAESSDIVSSAYGGLETQFGPEFLIPKPFDPRLIVELAAAVARAATESGVATRPIADWTAYRSGLEQFVFRSGYCLSMSDS